MKSYIKIVLLSVLFPLSFINGMASHYSLSSLSSSTWSDDDQEAARPTALRPAALHLDIWTDDEVAPNLPTHAIIEDEIAFVFSEEEALKDEADQKAALNSAVTSLVQRLSGTALEAQNNPLIRKLSYILESGYGHLVLENSNALEHKLSELVNAQKYGDVSTFLQQKKWRIALHVGVGLISGGLLAGGIYLKIIDHNAAFYPAYLGTAGLSLNSLFCAFPFKGCVYNGRQIAFCCQETPNGKCCCSQSAKTQFHRKLDDLIETLTLVQREHAHGVDVEAQLPQDLGAGVSAIVSDVAEPASLGAAATQETNVKECAICLSKKLLIGTMPYTCGDAHIKKSDGDLCAVCVLNMDLCPLCRQPWIRET